jgi:hypothetical protein
LGLLAAEAGFLQGGAVLGFEGVELVLQFLDFRGVDVFGERPFLVGEAGAIEGELDGAEADGRRGVGRAEERFELVEGRSGDAAELVQQRQAILLLGGEDGFVEAGDGVLPVVGGIAMNAGGPGGIGLGGAGGEGFEQGPLGGREGGGWVG